MYVLYAGVTNTFDTPLLVSIGLIIFETIVLIINKWACPLTGIARKYTSDRNANFDIYLPNWLAKHNKSIFSTLFIIGLILVIINFIRTK